MIFGAAETYGAQPVATPPAVRSTEQDAVTPRPSTARQTDRRADQRDADTSGKRALAVWIVLAGAAIALGWVSVSGNVRVGKG